MNDLIIRWPSRVANLSPDVRVGDSERVEKGLCSVHGRFENSLMLSSLNLCSFHFSRGFKGLRSASLLFSFLI